MINDVSVASLHGTSTKANDKNESDVTDKQFISVARRGTHSSRSARDI